MCDCVRFEEALLLLYFWFMGELDLGANLEM